MKYVMMKSMSKNIGTSIKDWKIGVTSSGINHLSIEKYLEYKKAGIDAIELSYNFEKDESFDIYKQKKLAKEAEIILWSFHLPWHHQLCNIAHLDKDMRNIAIDMDIQMIKKSADCGIKYGVIHPSGEPILKEDRNEAMKNAKESLYKLSKTADEEGFAIAVENLPRTCLGNCSLDMNQLLEASDSLKICFDVNHLLQESHAEFINKIKGKIVTLHISDYDFVNERHWMPGEGKINWPELIELLEGIGYEGIFMYELGLKPEKTIIRRDLNYSDFKNNFTALSEKRKPDAIGKPNV